MKKIVPLLAALALTALFIHSCTSPADVPANRSSHAVVTTDLSALEFGTSDAGNLGAVGLNQTVAVPLKFSNTSDKADIVINTAALLKGDQGFTLNTSTLPDTVSAKGAVGDSYAFNISFHANSMGSFEDELVFNGSTKHYKLKVNVIAASGDTLSIDTMQISAMYLTPHDSLSNEFTLKSIQVNTHCDTTITLQNLSTVHRVLVPSITMTGATDQFSTIGMPSAPFVVGKAGEANSSVSFTLRYAPTYQQTNKQVVIQFGYTSRFVMSIHASAYNRIDTLNIDNAPSRIYALVTPPQLGAGSVVVGSQSSLQIQVKNLNTSGLGNDTSLLCNSIAVSGTNASEFRINPPFTSCVIRPQEVKTFTVIFSPTSIGSKTCTVHIGTSALSTVIIGAGITAPAQDTVDADDSWNLMFFTPSDTVYFGEISLGSYQDTTITALNPSYTSWLRIRSEQQYDTSGTFVATGLPAVPTIMQPTAWFRFRVRFQPRTAGEKYDALYFGKRQVLTLVGTGK